MSPALHAVVTSHGKNVGPSMMGFRCGDLDMRIGVRRFFSKITVFASPLVASPRGLFLP